MNRRDCAREVAESAFGAGEVALGLTSDELVEERRRGGAAVVGQDLLEAPAIVEAEVLQVVLPLGQIDAGLRKDLAKQVEVEEFIINQDAIEVEDHRADH